MPAGNLTVPIVKLILAHSGISQAPSFGCSLTTEVKVLSEKERGFSCRILSKCI